MNDPRGVSLILVWYSNLFLTLIWKGLFSVVYFHHPIKNVALSHLRHDLPMNSWSLHSTAWGPNSRFHTIWKVLVHKQLTRQACFNVAVQELGRGSGSTFHFQAGDSDVHKCNWAHASLCLLYYPLRVQQNAWMESLITKDIYGVYLNFLDH